MSVDGYGHSASHGALTGLGLDDHPQYALLSRFGILQENSQTNTNAPTTETALRTVTFPDPGGPVSVMATGWAKVQQIAGSAGGPTLGLHMAIDGDRPLEGPAIEWGANFEVVTVPMSHARTNWTPAGSFTVTFYWHQTAGAADDVQHLASALQAIMVPA